MGVAASTNVKEIKIDQTDNKWDKLQTPKDKKRGFSISKRWVSSAEADSSSNRRTRQLSSSLEAAEKRAIEAEQRVRQLEREVGTLELRNMELAEEVAWLKKQLSDRPEVPILPRPSTGSNRNKDTNEYFNNDEHSRQLSYQTVAKLEEQIKRYEDEILKLKTKINKDTQRLQAELEDQKHNFDREMRSVDNHLMRANRLNEIYEDTIRQKLSSDVLSDLKTKANYELRTDTAPPFNMVGTGGYELSGNKNRAQLILDLSEQISNQKEKIHYLENDIVKRDLEIGHLKELMTTSEAVLQASLNASSSSFRKISNPSSNIEQQNQNQNNNNNNNSNSNSNSNSNGNNNNITRRPVVFSASRRHSASVTDNSKPLKVDYSNNGGKIRDEIETLLKSPLVLNNDEQHRRGEKSFDLITSNENELVRTDWSIDDDDDGGDDDGDDDDQSSGTKNKGHKRTVSAPKKSISNLVAPNKGTSSSLKNVYALSDDFEPVRVRESPTVSRMSVRPKTAVAPTMKNGSTLYNIAISELDELVVDPQLSPLELKPVTPGSSRNRTHSAPMLFKPRPATRDVRRLSRPEPEGHVTDHHRRATTVDATDVMSLNDVDINKTDVLKIVENEDDDEDEIVITETAIHNSNNNGNSALVNTNKPPRPVKRPSAGNPGSAASVYSSSALGSGEDNETSDEEIRRLLEKRSGRSNNRRSGVGGSAKSRDSGFLGESYTSAQSNSLWRNENATP